MSGAWVAALGAIAFIIGTATGTLRERYQWMRKVRNWAYMLEEGGTGTVDTVSDEMRRDGTHERDNL